jgi:hypothetical protein
MIKATAMTEQISKGQMGQPAACMIENNGDPCQSKLKRQGRADVVPPCQRAGDYGPNRQRF